MKTKIKSYDNKAIDSHDLEIPKPGSDHICLVVITMIVFLKKMTAIIWKYF